VPFAKQYRPAEGAVQGVSACQWHASCEPTEPAGETRRPLVGVRGQSPCGLALWAELFLTVFGRLRRGTAS